MPARQPDLLAALEQHLDQVRYRLTHEEEEPARLDAVDVIERVLDGEEPEELAIVAAPLGRRRG